MGGDTLAMGWEDPIQTTMDRNSGTPCSIIPLRSDWSSRHMLHAQLLLVNCYFLNCLLCKNDVEVICTIGYVDTSSKSRDEEKGT